MPIDLKKILAKKLSTTPARGGFKFETVGDSLIFKFKARRTENIKGDDAQFVDVTALDGKKLNPETGKVADVKPGPTSFSLGTHLRQLFDDMQPVPDDVIHLQLTEIKADKQNKKLFGFEFVERAASVVDDDDIPDFEAPKKK